MKKVLILLPKGFELLEASAFTDVIGWSKDVLKQDIIACFCGILTEVAASFGNDELPFIVKTNLLIDYVDANDYDALAIPGGFGKYGYYQSGFDESVLDLIRDFHRERKPIAAVCTAALILAKSGILDGHRVTTYHLDDEMYIKQLKEYNVDVCIEDVIVSENIITSSGPQTAPYVALKLVEMLTSKELSSEIARVMGYSL